MTTRPKLELEVNKPTEINLIYDDAITGKSQYGNYYLFAVQSNGAEYSFFSTSEVHSQLKNLKKGDKAFITKRAVQKGSKLISDYVVEIPNKKEISTQSAENKELSGNKPPDRLYAIMLQSYRDAISISQELNGMADPEKMAITLFIARSK